MISGRAAIAGIGELAPKHDTGEATAVELLSRVADLTVRDAGIALRDVDGLELAFVHGNGGIMGEQVSLVLGRSR